MRDDRKKRIRRAHLKQYAADRINVSQAPRALVFDRESSQGTVARKDWVCRSCGVLNSKNRGECRNPRCRRENPNVSYDYWFDNYGRVRTVTGPKHDKSHIQGNTFMQPVPETVGKVRSGYFHAGKWIKTEATPKQEKSNKHKPDTTPLIVKLSKIWASIDGRGHGYEDYHSKLVNPDPFNKVRMFFSGNRVFFARQRGNELDVSFMYSGMVLARHAFQNGLIEWKETIVFKISEGKKPK